MQQQAESRYTAMHAYMAQKIGKLQKQINEELVPEQKSNLFEGLSIAINGYTEPSNEELRKLIIENGGRFDLYVVERTNYILSINMSASTKANKKNPPFLKPQWLLDSIASNKVLPTDGYMTCAPKTTDNQLSVLPSKLNRHRDARDAQFLTEYRANSRFHLISTLAQEMKHHVNSSRQQQNAFPLVSEANTISCDRTIPVPKFSCMAYLDMDSFFVSIALLDRPDLKDKPLAVTHAKADTTKGYAEIASCSYAARTKGVKNGMLIGRALELCPELICVPYELEKVHEKSKALYDTLLDLTTEIRAISCDEAVLDLKNVLAQLAHGDLTSVCEFLRQKVFSATGCTVSVGIGETVLLARLAARAAKPNGFKIVPPEEKEEFIGAIEIKSIPGIGYSTLSKLPSELRTCADLRCIPLEHLKRFCGEATAKNLFNICRGIGSGGLGDEAVRKTISSSVNYGIRFTTTAEFRTFIERMVDELCEKMVVCDAAAKRFSVKLLIRHPDAPIDPKKFMGCGRCNAIQRFINVSKPVSDKKVILSKCWSLCEQLKPTIVDLRGITLAASNLSSHKKLSTIDSSASKAKTPIKNDAFPEISAPTQHFANAYQSDLHNCPLKEAVPMNKKKEKNVPISVCEDDISIVHPKTIAPYLFDLSSPELLRFFKFSLAEGMNASKKKLWTDYGKALAIFGELSRLHGVINCLKSLRVNLFPKHAEIFDDILMEWEGTSAVMHCAYFHKTCEKEY